MGMARIGKAGFRGSTMLYLSACSSRSGGGDAAQLTLIT
jgi:hypothetical protein